MRQEKVAIIDPIGSKAGLDVYNKDLLNALQKQEVEGYLYSDCQWPEYPERSFPFFSDTIGHRFSDIVLRPLRFLKVLRHALKQKCSTVIFHVFHFNKMDEWMFRKVKASGLKLILIVHDVESFVQETNSVRLKNICEQLADILVVQNNFTAEELRQIVSEEGSVKIRLIPHGHFLSLSAGGQDKKTCREILQLDPEKPLVIFFGMIKPTKGLDQLFYAWKDVRTNATLLVAGRLRNMSFAPFQKIIKEDLQEKDLRMMIRKINNTERDLLFRAADVIVLPYTRIYQSGVLLMALSYKLPVIATRLRGFEEIIQNEKNGLLVDVGNVKLLSNAIDKLCGDIELRKKMAENGLKTLELNHDWNRIASLYKVILF